MGRIIHKTVIPVKKNNPQNRSALFPPQYVALMKQRALIHLRDSPNACVVRPARALTGSTKPAFEPPQTIISRVDDPASCRQAGLFQTVPLRTVIASFQVIRLSRRQKDRHSRDIGDLIWRHSAASVIPLASSHHERWASSPLSNELGRAHFA